MPLEVAVLYKYGFSMSPREFVKKELRPRQKEFDDINKLDEVNAFCEKHRGELLKE